MSDLTYPEVGATASDLPSGYHHVRESRVIGHGRAAFDTASAVLLSWRMHQRAGVRKVSGPDVVVEGTMLRSGGCCCASSATLSPSSTSRNVAGSFAEPSLDIQSAARSGSSSRSTRRHKQ